jgi:hypothetical protein
MDNPPLLSVQQQQAGQPEVRVYWKVRSVVFLCWVRTLIFIFFCLVYRRHAYEYRRFTVGSYTNDVEIRS